MPDALPSPLDLQRELHVLTRQVAGLAELDRLLGMTSTPYPQLPPLPGADAARAGGSSEASQGGEPLPSWKRKPEPSAKKPRPGRPAPAAQAPAAKAPAAPARAPAPVGSPELAQKRVHNEGRLHALADRLSGCQRCRLSEGRNNLVFGQGDAAAELVFIGEGPGYHEDMQGLAFVGPSGALLTKMINAMGYLREEVFIANVVKCRPPRNRAPQPDELGTCLPFLREQLEIIRPRAICALGKSAAVGLGMIEPDASIGRSRGRLLEWNGVPTVLTYHPAYLLRTPEQKRKAWYDLQLLFPVLERRRPKPIRPDETESA